MPIKTGLNLRTIKRRSWPTDGKRTYDPENQQSSTSIHYLTLGDESPYRGTEDDFQKSCISYLKLKHPKRLFFHVPNGGQRNKVEGAKFKSLGVKKGVSDILILEPNKIYQGLFIELKTKKNRPTDEQRQFLINGAKRRYKAVVCYNLDAFMDLIEWYFQ